MSVRNTERYATHYLSYDDIQTVETVSYD